MELRHLRYFAAVADELHFGRAARKLNVSQPPLSSQIKDLEVELGAKLFNRSNRKVSLTQEGVLFRKRVENILQQVESAKKEVKLSSQGALDTVVIGYMGSAILRELTERLRTFKSQHPLVELEFEMMRSDKQVEALIDGEIDFGVVDLSAQFLAKAREKNGIEYSEILHDRICLVVPKNHRLAAQSAVEMGELKNERFVTLERHSFPSHYDMVISKCEQAGFSPNVVAMSSQTDVVMTYVATGAGVALVAECIARRWKGEVAFLSVDDDSYVSVYQISRRDSLKSSSAKFRAALDAQPN